eukprot:3652058-Heterocapsa_arctica.AAC.1
MESFPQAIRSGLRINEFCLIFYPGLGYSLPSQVKQQCREGTRPEARCAPSPPRGRDTPRSSQAR